MTDEEQTSDPGKATGPIEISGHVRASAQPTTWPHDADQPHHASDADTAPLRWRELLGVLSLVALADVTIYRGAGFAGLALWFATAPLLFWLSSTRGFTTAPFWITGGMLLVLAGKLVWCGSAMAVAIGFAWLVAFAMALAGFCPYVPEVLVYAAQTVQAGLLGLIHYGRRSNTLGISLPQGRFVSFALPVLAFLLFGGIFVLANPDLALSFGEGLQNVFDVVRGWVQRFSPEFWEIGFCGAALWIVLGLLRPLSSSWSYSATSGNGTGNGHKSDMGTPCESPLYAAFRNTLLTVIVLFAVYLVFEFNTLWFREFPKGFYYSGYAHEGAAWLTAALALATLMLSLVFRGDVLCDPRVAMLRRLAWVWSLENMLLAVAVYNRLFIYIGFNGMTRMRIVGLYGMTAVVVGFVLVLVKIARGHGFLWLVRRHLWTLAIAVYMLAITPSDSIVVAYNVRRIMAGDPAPVVQISVHPINSEGVLLLKPLLESDNEIIRDGIAAMLYNRTLEIGTTVSRQRRAGWSAYQVADERAFAGLRADQAEWSRFSDEQQRAAALQQFRKYAYQWY